MTSEIVRQIMLETCEFMEKHVKEHPNACGTAVNKAKVPTVDKHVAVREKGFWAGRKALYKAKP